MCQSQREDSSSLVNISNRSVLDYWSYLPLKPWSKLWQLLLCISYSSLHLSFDFFCSLPVHCTMCLWNIFFLILTWMVISRYACQFSTTISMYAYCAMKVCYTAKCYRAYTVLVSWDLACPYQENSISKMLCYNHLLFDLSPMLVFYMTINSCS